MHKNALKQFNLTQPKKNKYFYLLLVYVQCLILGIFAGWYSVAVFTLFYFFTKFKILLADLLFLSYILKYSVISKFLAF